MVLPPPRSTLFPYTTPFRSWPPTRARAGTASPSRPRPSCRDWGRPPPAPCRPDGSRRSTLVAFPQEVLRVEAFDGAVAEAHPDDILPPSRLFAPEHVLHLADPPREAPVADEHPLAAPEPRRPRGYRVSHLSPSPVVPV